MRNVLAVVLAGGKGERLEPLTFERTKPAVPFGGGYRIIDLTLSNCVNSGLRKLIVLTQYKAASLDRHIRLGWQFLSSELDEFVITLPPEQRIGERWYQGTADAVYQNIYTIERTRPEHVVVLSGDHVYRMDYSKLLAEHIENEADATICCLPVPRAEASRFGVMESDATGRVVHFEEKPQNPRGIPGDKERSLASMGIYVFRAGFLFEQLDQDATRVGSRHDFGRDVIPAIIDTHHVRAFRFCDEDGSPGYWRDVGTLDAYYEANMDLVAVRPQLNLYEPEWPIRTWQPPHPPAKFVFNSPGNGSQPRVGSAADSIVCQGGIVSGGTVSHSILSPAVRIHSWAGVEDSILFEGVVVERHARIRRAIIDKRVRIAEGTEIGFDHDADRARGWTVSPSGIVAVRKSLSE